VQDTSGDVIFSVTFKAITCLPEVNEVLDGKVIEVTSTGIQVQSGTIKCFITMKKIKNEYKYDQSSVQWIQQDELMPKVLEKGVLVRYRITTLKYLHSDFSVVGTIDEDYLGITKDQIC